MNAQLVNYLPAIRSEPFIGLMQQFSPSGAPSIDANTVQQFLSPEGQARIRGLITQAPTAIQGQTMASFNHLLETIKLAFSQSIDQVYLVSAAVMVVAFAAVWFLPQLAFRKDEHTAVQESALKLDEGLGQADKLHEPDNKI